MRSSTDMTEKYRKELVMSICDCCGEELLDIGSAERCWVASAVCESQTVIGQFNKAELNQFASIAEPIDVAATCFINESAAEEFKHTLVGEVGSGEVVVVKHMGGTLPLFSVVETVH